MPGAADHRDPLEAFGLRLADGPAHMGLTTRLIQGPGFAGSSPGAGLLPQYRHGFGDGRELIGPVDPMLNHMLPPLFPIPVSGHAAELVQRIGFRRLVRGRDGFNCFSRLLRLRHVRLLRLRPQGQLLGLPQVDEGYGRAVLHPVHHGLPFRRELREGIKAA
jgi:hypothetical protein